MTNATSRAQRAAETESEGQAPAELFVYCKGCGQQLESRARLTKPKPVVNSMMCADCQKIHGHSLMPAPGAPTYCYRCGTLEETFVAPGISPTTHHVCPRCLPDKVGRFRQGNFEDPPPEEQEDK